MKREDFTEILKKHYDSLDTIKSIRTGRMKPSYEKMIALNNDGIPFKAWQDIKSFISDNRTITDSRTDKEYPKERKRA